MDNEITKNFIENIIDEDNESNTYEKRVHTRFPPEPNGYLHIGHAKSICLNFGIAQKYGGLTNLRFDDTNPSKENVEYVNSIKEDVQWLGFTWDDRLFYTSDYFDKIYTYAIKLICLGKAYVDDLTSDEIREYRGNFSKPGKESPCRNRSVEENLKLFEEMKDGKYADGEKVLRAKIDMASPNINMRDPVIYRIVHAPHHRTGTKWCIYPMYDFAHPVSDAIERITHSICTLEFEDHRPLYNWCLENWEDADGQIPRQIEFARLNVTNMVMSKRKLRVLVEKGIVSGWDDPRMPTIAGIRRRGYTPEAIRDFCDRIGVAKADSTVDISLLEYCIREDLKMKAPRIMTVIDPIKVVIMNYPVGQTETMTAENNQENEAMGTREMTFSRTIYIERNDFMEIPVKKFFRLSPGKEVRLKYAYIIKCEEVIKDADGVIVELHCTYDPESKSGSGINANRKVKGTLHWVNAADAVDVETRIYDYLLKSNGEEETDNGDFLAQINPHSLDVYHSKAEAYILQYHPGDKFQFLRQGYFVLDADTSATHMVVNRIVGLRDTWAKMQKNK
ncbi:glutamate--tRNA ligase [Megasphaera cerevisiae DSM 20462]|jgi:glutaminyl-tRNA synthetase|uniref:Glutamine--tRNA ligase n=1 Tax=Megasphaera cerevisiae DSM 20462 TaxID=1122219 RepID=A0A0J6ZQV6_9FIRM|nr:glutamine--tRNA ligase/YqeY domain fusion protein [Megasphaera cerevisiae]KMO87341.1 glutamate--tRNA ligase [Megasphaera cerevisiae DSM 20462]OKY54862.1 glutamine--tRNA ligase [Megasphaera cerevisiae]SJZ39648.1 glutaminyl-tRNA synthetase [Megasphaera cerevisiae DSM 20462]